MRSAFSWYNYNQTSLKAGHFFNTQYAKGNLKGKTDVLKDERGPKEARAKRHCSEATGPYVRWAAAWASAERRNGRIIIGKKIKAEAPLPSFSFFCFYFFVASPWRCTTGLPNEAQREWNATQRKPNSITGFCTIILSLCFDI